MQLRPPKVSKPDIEIYIDDYIDAGYSVIITEKDGTDKVYTSKNTFLEDYNDIDEMFFVINNKDTNSLRAIHGVYKKIVTRYTSKMIFGNHADIISKEIKGSADTYFCDVTKPYSAGSIITRSCISNESIGGISTMSALENQNENGKGTRLIYNGNEHNVYIINDETESL